MTLIQALLVALLLSPAARAGQEEEAAPKPPLPSEVNKVLEAKEPELRSGAPLSRKVVSVVRLDAADEKALVEGLRIPASALTAPGGLSEAVVGRATNGGFLSIIRVDSRRRADAVIARSPGRRAAGAADLAEARTLYYDRGWAFDAVRREALGRIVSAGVPKAKPVWTANAFGVMEAPAARLGAPGAFPRAAARPAAEETPVRGRWEGDRYRTENFSVGAGPDRAYAQRLAEEAERHRLTMAKEWLGAAAPSMGGRPITLDYKLYGPGSRGGGGNTTYTVGESGITGTKMSIQGDRESLLKNILPHEVLHTVLASRLGAGIPRWADEGAASTGESAEEQRKKYLGPLSDAVARSRQYRLSDMMTMTQYPTDPNRIWEFYGQSNSVAHYLIEKGGGGAKGKQTLVNFLADGMKNDRWSDALTRHYGVASPSGLDAEWTRWHAGGGSARAIDRSGLPAPDTQLPVTPLPEPPAPVMPGDSAPAPAPRSQPRERLAQGGLPGGFAPVSGPAAGAGGTCSAGGCSGSSGAARGGSPASSVSGREAAAPSVSPAPAAPSGPSRPALPEERPLPPASGPARAPERAASAPAGPVRAPAAPVSAPAGPVGQPSFDARRGAVTMTVSLGGGGNAGGSGTVIASIPTAGRYRNVIITAGHTFDGYAGGPIMVTVMIGGKPVVVKARMVKYSYERRDMREFELAVLEFESDQALEAVKVARKDAAPGDEVFVVGKAWNEKEVTVHATRLGKPNTIGDGTFSRRQSTTEFIPVSGHSGGGLLNAAGELVGVVSGGNGRQGVHTPLEGVHTWLEGLGLGDLIKD